MDLTFDAADRDFRDMMRDEIAAMVPEDIRTRVNNLQHLTKDDYLRWQAILDQRGWATPAWPAEYGGPGWSPMQRVHFEEACFLAGAPPGKFPTST